MGQQPNIELEESDLPRKTPEPAPARRWRPTKAGLITSPEQKPVGGAFGHIGPDHGWAQRVVDAVELPDPDPDLRDVVVGLTQARAASFGRAPVREDVEVALILCGYGDNPPPDRIERRALWLAAAPHDKRPGQTAVQDVNPEYLRMKPAELRYALKNG
ncbi:MAG: hypothetical protein DWQ40_05195 [Actinobacteria bacterium]|nr:MAG: hypothetical protein DWQ40_05195 [Actinomycetota bacterium]REK36406.1 MAG: hypothetical protein DWQ20_05510 [Actinomycetota bacterium]